MNELYKLILFASLLLSNISCNNEQTGSNSPQFPAELNTMMNYSGMSLEARFDECGEWGGHRELVSISRDTNSALKAVYEVFPFNCDSLDKYYFNDSIKPISSKIASLNTEGIKEIREYAFQLSKDKMDEEFVGHSSNRLSIVSRDSTFIIHLHTNDQMIIARFRNLTKMLFK